MKGSDRKLIGYRVRLAREGSNLTQTDLGRIIGKSHAAISDIERGKTNLSVEELGRIAQVLNRDISDFLPSEQWDNSLINATFLRGGRTESGATTPNSDKVIRDFSSYVKRLHAEKGSKKK